MYSLTYINAILVTKQVPVSIPCDKKGFLYQLFSSILMALELLLLLFDLFYRNSQVIERFKKLLMFKTSKEHTIDSCLVHISQARQWLKLICRNVIFYMSEINHTFGYILKSFSSYNNVNKAKFYGMLFTMMWKNNKK